MKAVSFSKFINENKDGEPRFSPLFNPKTGKPMKKSKSEEDTRSRQGDSEEAIRLDLLKKFEDLSSKVKKADPKSMAELLKIREEIAKDRDDIQNHEKYEEFKAEGFPWGDTTLTIDVPLSKLKYELRKFQDRLERNQKNFRD